MASSKEGNTLAVLGACCTLIRVTTATLHIITLRTVWLPGASLKTMLARTLILAQKLIPAI